MIIRCFKYTKGTKPAALAFYLFFYIWNNQLINITFIKK